MFLHSLAMVRLNQFWPEAKTNIELFLFISALTQRTDIQLGAVLGFGTFGVVREVTEIKCLDSSVGSGIADAEALVDSSSFLYLNHTASGDSNGEAVSPRVPQQLNQDDRFELTRLQMSARCFRGGDARYALKHLMLEDANEKESDNARIDLAIEVKYLQVLSHPHIIKLRGLFKTDDPFHLGYFFIMDRLYGTLEDKIKEWADCQRSAWKKMFPSCYGDQMPHEYIHDNDLMTQRLLVAHDIASAFDYMHTNKVLHRWVKIVVSGRSYRHSSACVLTPVMLRPQWHQTSEYGIWCSRQHQGFRLWSRKVTRPWTPSSMWTFIQFDCKVRLSALHGTRGSHGETIQREMWCIFVRHSVLWNRCVKAFIFEACTQELYYQSLEGRSSSLYQTKFPPVHQESAQEFVVSVAHKSTWHGDDCQAHSVWRGALGKRRSRPRTVASYFKYLQAQSKWWSWWKEEFLARMWRR